MGKKTWKPSGEVLFFLASSVFGMAVVLVWMHNDPEFERMLIWGLVFFTVMMGPPLGVLSGVIVVLIVAAHMSETEAAKSERARRERERFLNTDQKMIRFYHEDRKRFLEENPSATPATYKQWLQSGTRVRDDA